MIPRRAQRRDGNEADLRVLAAELGIYTKQSGPLDLWAFVGKRWVPVEIKNPNVRHSFKKSQIEFMAECDAIGAPYMVWRDENDVYRAANVERTA